MKMGTRAFTPKGLVGCTVSHYLVLKEFLNGDSETCLVLEDDALLDDHVMENLSLVMSNAPKGWDMIKLASRPLYDGPTILFKFTYTYDYVARLVSREGARKQLAQRISWPGYPDITVWTVPDFNTYIVNKKYRTFYQTWEDSTIAGTRYPYYPLNLKLVKTGDVEWMAGDLLLMVVVVVVLLTRQKFKKFASKQ
jgi:GR25 family glycosyltransferase involved in LPS biosynthesis